MYIYLLNFLINRAKFQDFINLALRKLYVYFRSGSVRNLASRGDWLEDVHFRSLLGGPYPQAF